MVETCIITEPFVTCISLVSSADNLHYVVTQLIDAKLNIFCGPLGAVDGSSFGCGPVVENLCAKDGSMSHSVSCSNSK